MALDALKVQQMQMDAEDDVPLRRPSVVPTPRPQSLLVIPPTARPRSVAAPASATPRARPLSMMPPNANAHRASVFLRQSSGSFDTVGSGSAATVEDDDHLAKLAHDTFDLSDNEAADAFGANFDVAADIAHVPIPLAVPPRAVTALQLSDPYINTYTKASRAARAAGADLTVHVDHEDGVVVVTCPIARPRARMAAFLAMALDALKVQQMQMDAEDDVPLRRPSVVPTPRPQSLLVIPPTARPRSVAAPASATPQLRVV
ncbi:hypothetical protein AMAG_13729 [Allomyces macrogynus ATCC 38327]|uniref:Uncharacterized protein n=1 Tax=Allomyces macrogynus (strain ATCC 38327) TaxID=578462 RepID=A0A0L0T3P5_ALLM3|nr:hypothetical protein AMAG_13729 [Allomyces macrogynus ATCC 38327]|eukprot:KNE69362.1 hypothetical protein AMAG_13729 [Allomyces macrogynus ATCC 38327]